MTEKMIKSITCDNCEKELTGNPRKAYCLELIAKDVLGERDNSILKPVSDQKPIDQTMHFCNTKCLLTALEKGIA